jgi:hypothetical protein
LTLTPGGYLTLTSVASALPQGTPSANEPGAEISSPSGSLPASPDQILDISDKVDANGILSEDTFIQFKDLPVTLKIFAETQALTADNLPLTQIGLVPMDNPPEMLKGYKAVGAVYDLQPAGATFDPPALFVMAYQPEQLPKGAVERNLVIAAYDPGTKKWVELKSQVDTKNRSVSTEIAHFSVYALLLRSGGINWIYVLAGVLTGLLLAGFAIFVFLWKKNHEVEVMVQPAEEPILYLPAPSGTNPASLHKTEIWREVPSEDVIRDSFE